MLMDFFLKLVSIRRIKLPTFRHSTETVRKVHIRIHRPLSPSDSPRHHTMPHARDVTLHDIRLFFRLQYFSPHVAADAPSS